VSTQYARDRALIGCVSVDDAGCVATLIYEQANVNALAYGSKPEPLFRYAYSRLTDLLHRRNSSQSALTILFTNGNGKDPVDITRLLVSHGANVALRRRDGMTPLNLASVHGYAGSVHALLSAGADPNTADNSGATALMRAAFSNDFNTVSALIRSGASVSAKDRNGVTALGVAMSFPREDPKIVSLLRKHGATL
jgi:ankyrin repeat protein